MAFSVTYNASRENEKQQVLSLIRKNGGRVLEKGFDELFHMNALQTSSVVRHNEINSLSDGSNLTLTAAAREVGFACVIADEHSRRVKFMQALALGLPCISGRWIEHCVARKEILDWDQYHLAAGESSFLGGAIRSRNLQSYPASTANFANRFELRPKLLTGKSILLITGKGKAEERRKPYFFLTQALGARRVKHVQNNQEARKFLLEAEANGEEWNWVYVDENEDEAEKAIFGAAMAPPKKRKRCSEMSDDSENTAPPPKRVRIVSDEYVIQSLILGKFLEE
jgi:BRCT domain, a BRCA1 C-terminus domain